MAGQLPSFDSLASLQYLDLRGNSLYGTLPSVAQSPLTTLSVALNRLTGPLDGFFGDGPYPYFFEVLFEC